jgi:hypothetical protein
VSCERIILNFQTHGLMHLKKIRNYDQLQCSVQLCIIGTVCWQSWSGISGGKLVLTMADVKFQSEKIPCSVCLHPPLVLKVMCCIRYLLLFLKNSWKLPGDYTNSGHCLRWARGSVSPVQVTESRLTERVRQFSGVEK